MLELETMTLAADERLDKVNENITLIQKKNGLTYGSDAYLLSAFVRPDQNALCVDLGSGTAILPVNLYHTGAVLTATDIAANQIACGQALAAERGMDNIRFKVCSAEDTGFAPNSFAKPIPHGTHGINRPTIREIKYASPKLIRSSLIFTVPVARS
jgi:2-polyprenyl-3-methyl-5-hydroxy-6-metoxy-1,4-benzoquinol methylase